MKENMDELMKEDMNKEQILPASVRIAFDQSYEQIRKKAKKKTKASWLKPIAAAAAAITIGSTILLTNDTALAKLQAFLGINDPGLDTATHNGDLHTIAQTVQSENITMTLDNLFADAFRIGLQLTIESEDIFKDNLNDLSFEYRLFDPAGNEIEAFVSDTKEIAGPGIYTGHQFTLTNLQDNSATLELLAETTKTTAPSLEGAQLVVETVHFTNREGGITSVDGKWAFDLTSANVVTQMYVSGNSVPGLTLLHAVVTNGSMQVSYKIDEIIENENDIFETVLVNEKGESFYAKGATAGESVFTLVFPYSIWNEEQQLSLKVKGYEPLTLVKNE